MFPNQGEMLVLLKPLGSPLPLYKNKSLSGSEENPMSHKRKFLSVFILAALLALTFVTPARAFDGRSGDRVVIASDEVVNDDLYVGAEEFVLDGTVNGDVVVFARTVTINGEVD